jgi:hypothetical protein
MTAETKGNSMKKSHKRPRRGLAGMTANTAPKAASKPAMKAAPAKPAPTLVDVKNLVGQMKGILTWMAKERTELQNMQAQLQDMIASVTPAGSAEMTAETRPSDVSDSAGMTAEAMGDTHEEHGDPVVSGTFSDDESSF